MGGSDRAQQQQQQQHIAAAAAAAAAMRPLGRGRLRKAARLQRCGDAASRRIRSSSNEGCQPVLQLPVPVAPRIEMEAACQRAAAVVAAIRDFNVPAPIVHVSLQAPAALLVDLSSQNRLLSSVDPSDCAALDRVLRDQLQSAGATFGIGGYGERRSIYSRGEQFEHAGEVRCIHLGVDLWLPSGQEIFAPFKAIVHSFQNNDLPGDYGPTIILQHEIQNTTFYTLYGHLSAASLDGKTVGQAIEYGEKIACVGSPPVNGDWPPHLHFQIIVDMLGKNGDFPGVASEKEASAYMQICPDPNLVIRSALLR